MGQVHSSACCPGRRHCGVFVVPSSLPVSLLPRLHLFWSRALWLLALRTSAVIYDWEQIAEISKAMTFAQQKELHCNTYISYMLGENPRKFPEANCRMWSNYVTPIITAKDGVMNLLFNELRISQSLHVMQSSRSLRDGRDYIVVSDVLSKLASTSDKGSTDKISIKPDKLLRPLLTINLYKSP